MFNLVKKQLLKMGKKRSGSKGASTNISHSHYYSVPGHNPASLFVQTAWCGEELFSGTTMFDIPLMSEWLPWWLDEGLATLLFPDSIPLNVLAPFTCPFKSKDLAQNKYSFKFPWCQGQFNLFPSTGIQSGHIGSQEFSQLTTERLMLPFGRLGLNRKPYLQEQICEDTKPRVWQFFVDANRRSTHLWPAAGRTPYAFGSKDKYIYETFKQKGARYFKQTVDNFDTELRRQFGWTKAKSSDEGKTAIPAELEGFGPQFNVRSVWEKNISCCPAIPDKVQEVLICILTNGASNGEPDGQCFAS